MKAILSSIFYMPGIIFHELSHHLACMIFRAKVTGVCYYNFRESSGYVHYLRPKHLYQDVLISISPFFLNSLLSGLVAYPAVINKLSITGLESLSWQDILRIIISISIGMSAIPSKKDGLNVWNSVGDSNINFLFKLLARLLLAPLVFLIYLLNYGSAYFKINIFYGICTCLIGPKFIEDVIYLDIVQEFIDGFQNLKF